MEGFLSEERFRFIRHWFSKWMVLFLENSKNARCSKLAFIVHVIIWQLWVFCLWIC
jgi:hypothetical protein